MSGPATTYAIDTTHSSAGHVPSSTPYVIGYVSGSTDIKWTTQDWARFPSSRTIFNYQGNGPVEILGNVHEIDVEAHAVTPAAAAQLVKARVEAGYIWTTIYANDGDAAAAAAAIQALGHEIWNGHVLLRLADWNLNEAEARAKVGTLVHGMTCIGVQWASPESNPHTILPGTSLTLAQANADLSVVDVNWALMVRQVKPAPPPALQHGILVQVPTGAVRTLTSADGKIWQ